MSKYSQAIAGDGVAILCDGVALSVDEVIERLNLLYDAQGKLSRAASEVAFMIDKHNLQSDSDGSWLYDYQTAFEAESLANKLKGLHE